MWGKWLQLCPWTGTSVSWQTLTVSINLLLPELQLNAAATNVPTCRSIIDSLGFSANSHFGAGQAFVGGGCAHQTRNNWYQIMRPDGSDPTCEAAPPSGSAWQRICACTAYFLAQREESCQDACAAKGKSCDLEKVLLQGPSHIRILNFLYTFFPTADSICCNPL